MPRHLQYVQVPIDALAPSSRLSHLQVHVLAKLCQLRFQFTTPQTRDHQFYITDRNLASLIGCSNHEIWHAKTALKESGFIEYHVGPKNRTHYKLTF